MEAGGVERLKEPMCPQPDVFELFLSYHAMCSDNRTSIQTHILLPPLNKLRTIVDRLRPMADVLTVSANNNGGLRLSINTDPVQVDTDWTNCTHPKMSTY